MRNTYLRLQFNGRKSLVPPWLRSALGKFHRCRPGRLTEAVAYGLDCISDEPSDEMRHAVYERFLLKLLESYFELDARIEIMDIMDEQLHPNSFDASVAREVARHTVQLYLDFHEGNFPPPTRNWITRCLFQLIRNGHMEIDRLWHHYAIRNEFSHTANVVSHSGELVYED